MSGAFDPDLEVIARRPTGRARSIPLLFVHGGFAGAWCWDEYFLPWFVDRGYAAHAVSLRGHGGSGGRAELNAWGIEDYVEDVARTVEAMDRPPVLVGHSMGGYVAQKYLEDGEAAGLVLMASVPPRGLAGPGLSLAMWNPSVAFSIGSIQNAGKLWGSVAPLRDALFSDRMPDDRATEFLSRMGAESSRAMADMFNGSWLGGGVDPTVTALVLGADQDDLIPSPFVRATARSYGVTPHVFEELGHLMMLDTGWEAVAQRMLDWLHRNAL